MKITSKNFFNNMLNEIVIKLVKESGMNQREFAREYNISYSTLNHVINNESVCTFKFLKQITDKMKKTILIDIV